MSKSYALLFFACTASLATPAEARQWRAVGERDGVRVEIREVDGTNFGEIRVLARSDASVSTLCDLVWGNGTVDPDEPNLKHREIIEERGNTRITYEQVSVPIVMDRDYVVRSVKSIEPRAGVCQVRFEDVKDRGPKPQPGYVRIPRFYGSWTFEPSDEGGSVVTYTIFSDPGGGVPASLARGPQQQVVEWMQMVLEKGHRNEPKRASLGAL